jgi:hypothetical protein
MDCNKSDEGFFSVQCILNFDVIDILIQATNNFFRIRGPQGRGSPGSIKNETSHRSQVQITNFSKAEILKVCLKD